MASLAGTLVHLPSRPRSSHLVGSRWGDLARWIGGRMAGDRRGPGEDGEEAAGVLRVVGVPEAPVVPHAQVVHHPTPRDSHLGCLVLKGE